MGQVNSYRLEELRRIILPLQGLSHKPGQSVMQMQWGEMASTFPKRTFPTGAMHEMIWEVCSRCSRSRRIYFRYHRCINAGWWCGDLDQ